MVTKQTEGQVDMAVAAVPDALRLSGTLLLLMRALDGRVRAGGPGDGLTVTDIGVLGRIEKGAALPSVIARESRLDPARVTHLTDRLVERGYVERMVDPDDRRRWRLNLTSAGRERLAAGRGDVTQAMEELLVGLDADARAGIFKAMEHVRGTLDALPK